MSSTVMKECSALDVQLQNFSILGVKISEPFRGKKGTKRMETGQKQGAGETKRETEGEAPDLSTTTLQARRT